MPCVRVNGIDINYQVTDFTDPWTAPQTILLHHGFLRSLRFWYPWVPLLCRDYRVVTMDARGCGQSTAPPEGYRFSRDQQGDDAIGLMDALDIERAHWGGEGSGGLVGVNIGARYPHRLASLTLCNTPIKPPKATHDSLDDDLWREGAGAWARRTAAWRFDVDRLPDGFLEWSIAENSRTPRHVAMGALDMRGPSDGRAALAAVRAPTLVLAGENSQVATVEQVKDMETLIPQAKVVMFKGFGQGIADTNAEACAWEMLGFLKGLA